MNIRHAILPMLIIFLFTSVPALGQSVENSTSSDNSTLSDSMAAAGASQSSTMQADSSDNAQTNSSAQNLKYIWSITGIEKDPIIMALDQDGSDLFGQAKYEPDDGDVWNGNVVGSISESKVEMTITAQKGKSLESIKLDGAYVDDALSGKFTRISEGKITSRGDFNAVWISPDISSYTPAQVTEATPATEPQKTETTLNAPAQQTSTSSSTSTTDQTSTDNQSTQPSVKLGGKTKYVDVHEYAEKIGPGGDLSGVPPGMGGSGLG
ncbi:MAG: hypothetical protein ACE14P_00380 [Methanotrichaceae archaeon]